MTAPVFVDTNVFVYARQASEGSKQRQAEQWLNHLWREQLGRTSMQVLNEYYATLTRKINPALSADEAWDKVRNLLGWIPQPTDADMLLRAREIERRHRLNWWDCLIVAAAQAQNCLLLLSEDFQDGAEYGGVTVRNPFTLGVNEAAALYIAAPTATRQHRPRGRPKRLAGAAA